MGLLWAINASRPDLRLQLATFTPDASSSSSGSVTDPTPPFSTVIASTFALQLQVILRTRVLIAFHGASLAHLLFLAPGASVLELTVLR